MNKNKLDKLRLERITKQSIKCKFCGHTILPGKDRGICTHCGHWCYKNEKVEFRYKLLENMKKRGK